METNYLILEWKSLARSLDPEIRQHVLRRRIEILGRLNELGVGAINNTPVTDLLAQESAALQSVG